MVDLFKRLFKTVYAFKLFYKQFGIGVTYDKFYIYLELNLFTAVNVISVKPSKKRLLEAKQLLDIIQDANW